MPNVVGLCYEDATTSLINAGVLVPGSIGYFGTWPITITWNKSTAQPVDFVLTQSPAANASVTANSAVTLSVSAPPMSVAYP